MQALRGSLSLVNLSASWFIFLVKRLICGGRGGTVSGLARRTFLNKLGMLGGILAEQVIGTARDSPSPLQAFKLSVISDELSQDFENALEIMKGYGLSWVELRGVWGIYNTETTPEQTRRLKDLLDHYDFRVSMLDTALFKCAYPGTERWVREPDRYPYKEQGTLLLRAIERAQALGTDKIRIFSFWRVPRDRRPTARIVEEISSACQVACRSGMRLLLENEPACNVSQRDETEEMLHQVREPNLGMNWDVGNAFRTDGVALPSNSTAFPYRRIGNFHLKDVRCRGRGKCEGALVGDGQVDMVKLLRALHREGFQGTLSLETHYTPPGLSQMEATKRSIEALLKVMARALA